jgi:hypothetical protein
MQIKLLFRLVLSVIPLAATAQSTYIRTGSGDYQLLERLEIKARPESINQSFVKPYSRKSVFVSLNRVLNDSNEIKKLTAIDRYNIDKFLNDPEFDTTANVYHQPNSSGIRHKGNSGFWTFDPVTRTEYSKESNSIKDPLIATIGFDMRGIAFKSVGFNFYVTANAERLPGYLDNWTSRYNAIPGIGKYKARSEGKVTYMDIRGSIQTPVTKYIDLQLGYDRLFLGNGHRSLFLSDASNSMAFFKINAKLWKLNFQSLYMKLTPQEGIIGKATHKKFLRINTLGVDVTKWLNISVFDAVVLGRENGFDLNYVLPVTFLRAMEQQSGSPDNAMLGINVKANVAGKIQLYAQGLLDEFKLSEIKAGTGWWANKFGYQLGVKYIDAFGLKNMDVQIETNRIRPFTYTHYDSVSNYTHSNQPLAHPLGASFHEFIGIVRYQPFNKLHINAKAVYYIQGLDSLGLHTGNNLLTTYSNRPRNYGWEVGSGNKAKCLYLSGNISYEIYNNLFVDASVTNRSFKTELGGDLNSTILSLGIRWNINRRTFDF